MAQNMQYYFCFTSVILPRFLFINIQTNLGQLREPARCALGDYKTAKKYISHLYISGVTVYS
jgi:hypothetical protein